MSFNKISLLIILLLNNAQAASFVMPEMNTQNALIVVVTLFLLILVFRLTKKPKKKELVDILESKLENESEELTNETAPTGDGEFEVTEAIDDPYAIDHEETHEEKLPEAEEKTENVEAVVSDADTFSASVADEELVEVQEPEPVETPAAAPVVEKAQQTKSRVKHPRDKNHDKIKKEDFVKFAGMNILVAEDNLINQKVIKGLLGESQMNVVMADDGQFALDILEENHNFSVILMDAHMPRIDGFEATRIIRANPAYDHIAVIALSGDTAADDIRAMNEAGMEQHLEKPLKMDHLYEILSMYHGEDEEEVLDEVEEIASVESSSTILDRTLGLEVCGGDKSLYEELIGDFVDAYGESDVQIQGFIAKDDFDSVARLLLDIKGIAAQIGSNELSLCADELRNAVIAKDYNIISTLEQNYHRTLHQLLQALK